MLIVMEYLSAFCTFFFAGASLYITLVEHPARMEFETRLAAMFWKPSYHRATFMQASLAVVGCASGLLAWSMGAERHWLCSSLLLGVVVPFTLIVIRPTNKRLEDSGRDLTSPETRRLLERWGWLHAVRTTLSVIASAVILELLIK
jgi:Domain of unknown function (DUF1772)